MCYIKLFFCYKEKEWKLFGETEIQIDGDWNYNLFCRLALFIAFIAIELFVNCYFTDIQVKVLPLVWWVILHFFSYFIMMQIESD